MDGILLLAGLWHRFRRKSSDEEWEHHISAEVERVTSTGDKHIKLSIPALQSELGRRLELATSLMKDKGYRLHMVTPESGLMWAAGYERTSENGSSAGG